MLDQSNTRPMKPCSPIILLILFLIISPSLVRAEVAENSCTLKGLLPASPDYVRCEQLARLRAAAGAVEGSAGTSRANLAPSRWAESVIRKVKPFIVFNPELVSGNPPAIIQVSLAPDGAILTTKILSSSGYPGWDEAVLLALSRAEILPLDENGKIPQREVKLTFVPKDFFLRPPSTGQITSIFRAGETKGIDYSGNLGDPIYAAADGKVVYAGNSLRGFGNLVIIKHDQVYLTAYAHNNSLLVREGDVVRVGDVIAHMGSTDSPTVKLHFELREKGSPIDPQPFLPPLSSVAAIPKTQLPKQDSLKQKSAPASESIKRCTRMGLTPNSDEFNLCIKF